MNNDVIENPMNRSIATVSSMYEKYANDPYMISKITHYVCNQLPNILENMKKTHEFRVLRLEELTTEQDGFIQSFLNNNQYFYVSSTEKFFYYDGVHYKLYNEDDILYHVLSSISRDRQLMSWKYRTKINIMKRIKENNLLKSIPESDTIQHVLDMLYPTFFSSKPEAKYFLTIIGDNILKKNTDLIHFIHAKSKPFIRELNNFSQIFLGTNLNQTFKYKYHEHDYNFCRLLKINDTIQSENLWMPLISQSCVDILCVAAHYSLRYNNSDEFIINTCNESTLIASVFYLKNTRQETLIQQFLQQYIPTNSFTVATNQMILDSTSIRTTQITWKNMQYLWRHFLGQLNLPTVMFQQTLKQYLINSLRPYYNEDLDSFIGVCSKQLPAIQKFLQYWDETIVYDESECESEFEIEEIMMLYKKWCLNKGEPAPSMNDKQTIDIIRYYFSHIEIEKDKYIYKIRCNLWDKSMDIQMALENMKDVIRDKYMQYCNNRSASPLSSTISPVASAASTSGMNISIYDAYTYYCKQFSDINSTFGISQIVSKSYFEKYICENLTEYVIDSKFISVEWFLFE